MIRPSWFLGCLLALALGACAPAAPAARPTSPVAASATQAALEVATEIARPSSTPTPPPSATPLPASATPSPLPSPTLTLEAGTLAPSGIATPKPGLMLYTSPDIPDYVFQIAAARWAKDSESGNLVDQKVANCRIEAVPGHGLGQPQRLLYQDLGQFRWEILDYGKTVFAHPIAGENLAEASSYLQLVGYQQDACRSDLERVLADLLTRRQALGKQAFQPYASPTARPQLEGFSCPNAPQTRLRVGDEVSVITDGLWLRSEPRADVSTKLRSFLRYAPYFIRITDGPVCEKYVYWKVEVTSLEMGVESIQGWLAEGDPQEYYLAPIK